VGGQLHCASFAALFALVGLHMEEEVEVVMGAEAAAEAVVKAVVEAVVEAVF